MSRRWARPIAKILDWQEVNYGGQYNMAYGLLVQLVAYGAKKTTVGMLLTNVRAISSISVSSPNAH